MVEVILGGYLEAQAYYKASLSLYQWNFSQSSEWFQVSSSFFFCLLLVYYWRLKKPEQWASTCRFSKKSDIFSCFFKPPSYALKAEAKLSSGFSTKQPQKRSSSKHWFCLKSFSSRLDGSMAELTFLDTRWLEQVRIFDLAYHIIFSLRDY